MLARFLPLVALAPLAAQDATPAKVDFARDIQPILSARCYECHGEKEQEGDLRLDRRAAVFGADEKAWVIKPGKPDDSELIKRIKLPKSDADVMPAEGEPLTAAQIALFEQWVREGAEWPESAAAAAPAHTPKVETFDLTLTEAETKAVDAAVEKLLARGAVAGAIARDLRALDVNLSLLRPAATDADLALLRDLGPALVWLNLSRTQVTDAGMSQLAGLRHLRRLHLAQTAIGDEGLAHVRGLADLRFLNLFGTKVTDRGLAHLHGLGKLEKVFLWQSGVTDAGVAALQQALPKLLVDRGGYAEQVLKVAEELAAAEAKEKEALPNGIVNAKCPVAGKPINPECTLEHDGRKIAFCCADCRAKFEADPAKFLPNVPAKVDAKAEDKTGAKAGAQDKAGAGKGDK